MDRGFVHDPEYTESTIDLQPDDRIYFYSDGLTEAGERSVEMFGSQRLMTAVDENRHLPLRDSTDVIINTATDSQGDESFSDDISIMAIEIE